MEVILALDYSYRKLRMAFLRFSGRIFDLERLPELPLRHVLRYLDYSTLREIRSANSAMRDNVDSWRLTLAAPRIHSITIIRWPLIREYINYNARQLGPAKYVVKASIQIEENSVPKSLFFWRTIDDDEEEMIIMKHRRGYDITQEILDESLFVEWLAATLNFLDVGRLNIIAMSLKEEEIVKLLSISSRVRFSTTELLLSHSMYSVEKWERWTRFLMLVKMKKFIIRHRQSFMYRLVVTHEFLEWLTTHPTLEMFANSNYDDRDHRFPYPLSFFTILPTTWHKFPRIFIVTDAILTKLETFQTAIKTWLEGEVEAKYWLFNLDPEHTDTLEMSRSLNCQYELLDSPNEPIKSHAVLTNVNGKKNVMFHVLNPEIANNQTSCWHFGKFEPERYKSIAACH